MRVVGVVGVTGPLRLVLFDLDGTLVDTAPDLAAAANACRLARGLPALPLADLRPFASQGARGLLGRAFGLAPGDVGFEPLRADFLASYERALCVHSRLFDGMDRLLDALDAAAVGWGVVTNKAARFTDPLIRALGLAQRTACVVSGDTTPHVKPHPAPVLHALAACAVAAEHAVFVGDDRRDIDAGKAAGVVTAAAAYGYLAGEDDIGHWQADFIAVRPADLHDWLIDRLFDAGGVARR